MPTRQSTTHTFASFLSLLFVALTLGLTFAHVLEITGKLRLGPREWLAVQQNLYVAFGPVGGTCEVLAIAFTWLTLWQRRGSSEACYTWVAAITASVGLIAWAVIVSPMNTVLSSWTTGTIPADWTRVRNRWEIGHASQAMLYAIAFGALALAPHRATVDAARASTRRPA